MHNANYYNFYYYLSAILTVLYSTIFKSKVKPGGLLDSAFKVGPVWMTLRILAVVFVWMTYFKLGSKGYLFRGYWWFSVL